MTPKPYLNYTILGLPKFQVFPLEIYDEQALVDKVLDHMCGKSDDNVTASKSEFWLVCDNTRTPDRTKG